jgi:enamine deaminase RidA (YjgF/YER057c/UK114 family)
MNARRLVSSGSPFEPEIGFSRAVRVGAQISVAGTAPVSTAGGNVAVGDVYGQTKRCLEIINAAIVEAGGALQDVTRTRVMLVDMATWREAARAHGLKQTLSCLENPTACVDNQMPLSIVRFGRGISIRSTGRFKYEHRAHGVLSAYHDDISGMTSGNAGYFRKQVSVSHQKP